MATLRNKSVTALAAEIADINSTSSAHGDNMKAFLMALRCQLTAIRQTLADTFHRCLINDAGRLCCRHPAMLRGGMTVAIVHDK